MDGLELLEPTGLFNLLNQETNYPMLSNPCYLLLLDVRISAEYMESHILTARLVKRGNDESFQIPSDTELETKQNIVVYDNRTTSLSAKDSQAVMFGNFLWENGSKYSIKILKGGYEEFSAFYPFLRTQDMIYMPRELDNILTYPVEVIPGFLYSGTFTQSQREQVNKDLKIKTHINVSKNINKILKMQEAEASKHKPVKNTFDFPVDDKNTEDILKHFEEACQIIDSNNDKDGQSVLVFSDLGISRSIVICAAYLMHHWKSSLETVWHHMKQCKQNMCPNMSFMKQLSSWEEKRLGEKITELDSLNY